MKPRSFHISSPNGMRGRLLQQVLLSPAFVLALGLSIAFAILNPPEIPQPSFDQDLPLHIKGWICGAPVILDDRIEFELQPTRVTQKGQLVSVWGKILVRIYSATWPPEQFFGVPLSFGESLETTGFLVEPAFNAVPGVPDSRRYAVLRHTYYRLRIKSPLQLERDGFALQPIALIQVPLFRYIQAFEAAARIQLSPVAFQMVSGAFLGRRHFLEPERTSKIQELGIQHLFVVSGLHVGLVFGFVALALQRYGLRGQIVALGVMWGYIVSVGLLIPSVRAGILATVAYLLLRKGIRVRLLNALGVSAILLLAFAPISIHSPSFQFSFAAMVTICLVGIPSMKFIQAISLGIKDGWTEETLTKTDSLTRARRWSRYWVEEHLEFLPRSTTKKLLGLVATLLPYISSLLIISGSIQIAITPLVLFYTNRLNPYQILGNVLLIPLFTILVPVSLGFFLTFWLPLSQILVLPIELLTRLTDTIVNLIAGLAKSSYLPHPSAPEAIAYFTVLIATYLLIRYDHRFILPILLVSMFVLAHPPPSVTKGRLELTFLDVGQGDCIHLEYPDGSHGLIDTGPTSYTGDPDFVARRVVGRYLWNRRIRQLAFLLISHPENDHRGGYPFLSQAFGVKRLFFYQSQTDYAEPAIQLSRNRHFTLGGVRHTILHPQGNEPRRLDTNDASLVTFLRFGHFSALFTGDISRKVERKLPQLETRLTVLKVAHHGSRTSTSDLFLERARPQIAVISAGRRNRFGHPARQVVERLGWSCRAVLTTQKEGTIRIRTDGIRVSIEGYDPQLGYRMLERFKIKVE